MRIIEGADYFVRVIPFPNYAVKGAVMPNDDGTFSIYINSKLSPAERRRTIRHELAHIRRNHFYRQISKAQAEKEARSAE